MKKLFLMFCLSALSFAGCKKSSPEAYSSKSGKVLMDYCINSSQTALCRNLEGKTEMSPQDVKPVMKLEKNSTNMLYGASDPIQWSEGYSNLPIVDENGDDILYTTNFSVESGSILETGTVYMLWGFAFNLNSEKLVGQPREFVPSEVGGNNFKAIASKYKTKTLVQVAIFDDLGKYFPLPPLHIAP